MTNTPTCNACDAVTALVGSDPEAYECTDRMCGCLRHPLVEEETGCVNFSDNVLRINFNEDVIVDMGAKLFGGPKTVVVMETPASVPARFNHPNTKEKQDDATVFSYILGNTATPVEEVLGMLECVGYGGWICGFASFWDVARVQGIHPDKWKYPFGWTRSALAGVVSTNFAGTVIVPTGFILNDPDGNPLTGVHPFYAVNLAPVSRRASLSAICRGKGSMALRKIARS